MKRLHKKIAVTVASSALLLSSFAPAFAGSTTIEISGNGAQSDNNAEVEVEQKTNVVQLNDANISNYVEADADTGNNDANANTGGNVSVDTGDATTNVDVSNSVNTNTADVDSCDCNGSTDVLISGNGFDSDNKVDLKQENKTEVYQDNIADVHNVVRAGADTGDNDANRNTGGDVSVDTGDATVGVNVSNSANANSARVGGGSSGGGSLSARIVGNGTKSDNEIKLKTERKTSITQLNDANVSNFVKADADTGNNDANANTGGDVDVETGDATVGVGIDNMTNFNVANVDCGCLLDVLAKIAGNGFKSDNDIKAELEDELEVWQENSCDGIWRASDLGGGIDFVGGGCLSNGVRANADTGDNDANRNGGDPGSDPSVDTGDAETDVSISNSGNVNAYGEDAGFELPGGFSFNFNFSLDLSALLGLLGA